jgi:hypothetical protein
MKGLPFAVALALTTILLSFDASSQQVLLDDFETLTGWTAIVSEGAKLAIASGEGKAGRAMVMDFDLSGVYGYVIAQKEFSFDLPSNYQFTFDMKADAPVNNFEFKLIDDKENVFWIKKLSVEYPKTWTRQSIRKRHLSFAWGPARVEEIRTVRKIQFVVSVATGGKGRVFFDNFRFEPIDDRAGQTARADAEASSSTTGNLPRVDAAGTVLTDWTSEGGREEQWLTVDFHRPKEVGGFVIDWDSTDFAVSYDALLSDDGKEWTKAYSVSNGNGGRDYGSTKEGEGRFFKLALSRSSRNRGYGIRRMEFKGPDFSSTPNQFFHAIAADARAGLYPKYLRDRQSYWTIMGVDGDTKEALVNEQGQVEVDKLQFSLEPFLYIDGKLVTWSDVTTTPSLLDDYLPVPSVTWSYQGHWALTVEGVAAGVPGNSLLGLKYSLKCTSPGSKARLFIAIRPFQVNPPWQALNIEGGVSRIDSIINHHGLIQVNGVPVIPMTPPTRFGVAEFDKGHITEYLVRGAVPPDQEVRDHFGYASGALEYEFDMTAGETRDVYLAVPFHGWRGSPTPNMSPQSAATYFEMMLVQTRNQWESKLNRIQIALPSFAQPVINTLRSNLAYILINRDGPGIQPGSRSYERSWIRDGALTCSALLRTGHRDEVREFIDWYAQGQFPSGKIPCVIDTRGPDAVPEHDSNGEFIYAVLQYFLFSKDTLWLRGKFDAVTRTVRYIQSLRAERKTDTYRNGTAEQRACFGLVPESISHEGYWDVPRHSYWDDFFVLRGLKDAATIAAILGEKKEAAEYAAERDDFQKDLYASIRLAMGNKKIDYIPGCAELGDFDATSTTIAVDPGGELGKIPEPQLHNTFDKYYAFFAERKKKEFVNYTPYETRVIGTFVRLGQKKRAAEALEFFMHDRRPPEWNHWAEVVWCDPDTPKYIGDMPHTWVGSDFIRSVLSMFVYERESDGTHLLAAGIPEAWVNDPAGIQVNNLPTSCGTLNYTVRKAGKTIVAEISGSFDAPNHRLALASPLPAPLHGVSIGGKKVPLPRSGEVAIKSLPARVVLTY